MTEKLTALIEHNKKRRELSVAADIAAYGVAGASRRFASESAVLTDALAVFDAAKAALDALDRQQP